MIYAYIWLIIVTVAIGVIIFYYNRKLDEITESFVEKMALISIKVSEQTANYAEIIEKINEINSKIHDSSFTNFEESEKQYIKGLNNLLNYHGEQQT